jgi:PST family polysaccharide transporter
MYVSLLARVIFIMLVFFFIKEKDDNKYFLFFSGIGNLVAGCISIIIGYKLLRLKRIVPSRSDVRTELKKGWHIATSNLSVSIYMYVNILVLRVFTNDTIVGYYSISERIIFAARQMLSVYFQAIYPQVCQLAIKSKEELSHFFTKYYTPFLVCVFGGCCVLFFFPKPVVGFFLNENQAISAEFLRILSFVPFIVCLNIPAYQVLLVFNEKKALLTILTLGTVVNITLSLFLIPVMGALGTSYIVFITELLITMGLIFAMVNNQKTRVRFVI